MDKHKYSERGVTSFIVADSRVKPHTESFGTFFFYHLAYFCKEFLHLITKTALLTSWNTEYSQGLTCYMVESWCEKLFSLILSKIFRLVVLFSGLWKECILTQFHCFIFFNGLDNHLGTQCLNLKPGQLVAVNMFTLSFLCSDFNLLFSTTFFATS